MTDTSAQDRLREIRERVAAATPGPWYGAHADAEYDHGLIIEAGGGRIAEVNYEQQTGRHHPDGDTDLIANAPDDLAWLLSQAAALEADKRRLDWLMASTIHVPTGDGGRWPSTVWLNRDWIDAHLAAMQDGHNG